MSNLIKKTTTTVKSYDEEGRVVEERTEVVEEYGQSGIVFPQQPTPNTPWLPSPSYPIISNGFDASGGYEK